MGVRGVQCGFATTVAVMRAGHPTGSDPAGLGPLGQWVFIVPAFLNPSLPALLCPTVTLIYAWWPLNIQASFSGLASLG